MLLEIDQEAEIQALREQLRETKAALRDSEERFQTMMEGLQVGVAVQAPDASILFTNQLACELLGLTEDQLRGRSSFDPRWRALQLDGSPFPPDETPTPKAIATRKPVRNVVMGIYRPTSDDHVWLLVTAMPQLREDGSLVKVVVTFTDISERIHIEHLVREQATRLSEMSTPLIPISDDVVAMPLIGTIDEKRAAQVLETLLSGIAALVPRTAILDITGVAVVDQGVAEGLVQAARAAKLLGAEVVITGVRPAVARTLLDLDVDLRGVVTRSTLKAGIAHALGSTKGREKKPRS